VASVDIKVLVDYTAVSLWPVITQVSYPFAVSPPSIFATVKEPLYQLSNLPVGPEFTNAVHVNPVSCPFTTPLEKLLDPYVIWN
jgi:hypothetical protein